MVLGLDVGASPSPWRVRSKSAVLCPELWLDELWPPNKAGTGRIEAQESDVLKTNVVAFFLSFCLSLCLFVSFFWILAWAPETDFKSWNVFESWVCTLFPGRV